MRHRPIVEMMHVESLTRFSLDLLRQQDPDNYILLATPKDLIVDIYKLVSTLIVHGNVSNRRAK